MQKNQLELDKYGHGPEVTKMIMIDEIGGLFMKGAYING